MARTLDYIEDVEQFARINQLKKAIEEVRPLLEDTTNFILAVINRTGAGKWHSVFSRYSTFSRVLSKSTYSTVHGRKKNLTV